MWVLVDHFVHMQRLVCKRYLVLVLRSMSCSATRTTKYSWQDGVVLVVAMLVTNINE